jgi:serine-type D-Ala-D-Ala carboxypeptidase/endopeptidase (penicillin-binding protein 4)
VLELFGSGLVSIWLDMAGLPNAIGSEVSTWQEAPWIVLLSDTDPAAKATLQQYLKELNAKGFAAQGQGVWLQAGTNLLADHQGTTPLPAASLTKVATSLVALKTWGPQHQFETVVSATGPIANGVLQGDLIIQGNGDPLFVWEEAIALGNALNQKGIKRVTGNLVITGSFAMNFEYDPIKAGTFLKEGLDSRQWTEEPQYQYQTLPPGTPRPQVEITGSVRTASLTAPQQVLLLRHQSLPLTQILKLMNIYSNNAIAEMLAQSAGGAQTVAQQAALTAGFPPNEIQLINGSGLGPENRISPRAVCAMFIAIQRYLQPYGLSTADLFPVAGRDGGTIDERKIPNYSAVKTGTLWDVSTLAGVMPTRDRGLVWFAILNRGADLDGLRGSQDKLLQQLLQRWGSISTPPISLNVQSLAGSKEFNLGDPQRIQSMLTE